jgi:hypothetical protein
MGLSVSMAGHGKSTGIETLMKFDWRCVLLLCLLLVTGGNLVSAAMRLEPEAETVKPGAVFVVKAAGGTSSGDLKWTVAGQARLTGVDQFKKSAVFVALKKGEATVKCSFKGKPESEVSCTIVIQDRPRTYRPPSEDDEGKKPELPPSEETDKTSVPDKESAKASDNKVQALLDEARAKMEAAGVLSPFQHGDRSSPPQLSSSQIAAVEKITADFMQKLAQVEGPGGMKALQRFKTQWRTGKGGNVLNPGGVEWSQAYGGIEAGLMAGRAKMAERAWNQALNDYLKADPEGFALFFAELDIGSWVNPALGKLTFEADIDFSAVSSDGGDRGKTGTTVSRDLVKQFEANLLKATGLNMIGADVVMTAHGAATTDVFIGHWGQAFAEVDLLKRGEWKMLKRDKSGNPIRNADGTFAFVKLPAQLFFIERALRAGDGEAVLPKISINTEPMLSLEMLRHEIHDVAQGEFARGQKLIKVIKYLQRSYDVTRTALKPYQNTFPETDAALGDAVAEILKAHKAGDWEGVSKKFSELMGEELTASNIEAKITAFEARAQTAMHDNAARALAFRLNAFAQIKDDARRMEEVSKFWNDLQMEIKAFEATGVTCPELVRQAAELARQCVEAGGGDPKMLEQKSAELHKLLNDSFKVEDKAAWGLIPSDVMAAVRTYLKEKMGWPAEKVAEFVVKATKRFPKTTEFVKAFQDLNAEMSKTMCGGALLGAADQMNNLIGIYDAYMKAPPSEKLKAVAWELGTVALTEKIPLAGIPLGVWNSYQSGDPRPAAMAVGFYFFPWAGVAYMVDTNLRLTAAGVQEKAFYDRLTELMAYTEFKDGKISKFSFPTPRSTGGPVDFAVTPPGDLRQIARILSESPELSANAFLQWFRDMVPRDNEASDVRVKKMDLLMARFPNSQDLQFMAGMLKAAAQSELPQDSQASVRSERVKTFQTSIETALWMAAAEALQSAVRSSNPSELAAWRKTLADLAAEVGLSDSKKGLLATLDGVVRQQTGLFTQMVRGDNPYVLGQLYDSYIASYREVRDAQSQILHTTWKLYGGADITVGMEKPVPDLLYGLDGAPPLICDPVKDVEAAKLALREHRKAAQELQRDLADALGRQPDVEKDAAVLKKAGRLKFELTQLLLASGGKGAGDDATFQKAFKPRRQALQDLLASLKQQTAEVKAAQAATAGKPRNKAKRIQDDAPRKQPGTVTPSTATPPEKAEKPSVPAGDLRIEVVKGAKREGSGWVVPLGGQAEFRAIRPGLLAVKGIQPKSLNEARNSGGAAPSLRLSDLSDKTIAAQWSVEGDGATLSGDGLFSSTKVGRFVVRAKDPETGTSGQVAVEVRFDLTGKWSWVGRPHVYELRQNGTAVSGAFLLFGRSAPLQGTVDGTTLHASVTFSDMPMLQQAMGDEILAQAMLGRQSTMELSAGDAPNRLSGVYHKANLVYHPGEDGKMIVTAKTVTDEQMTLERVGDVESSAAPPSVEPLEVKLVLEPSGPLLPGQTAQVRAEVSGTKPDDGALTYAWQGQGVTGSGASAQLRAIESGQGAAVMVRSASGREGVGQISVEIAPLDVKVTCEEKPIAVGKEIELLATVTSQGKPVSGPWKIQWQTVGSSALDFLSNEEAPGAIKARCLRPGPVEVWANAVMFAGEAVDYLAESNRMTLTVVPPKLEVNVAEGEIRPGEEFVMKLGMDPEVEDAVVEWGDAAGLKMLTSRYEREVRCRALATGKQSLPVEVRTNYYNDPLGSAEGTVTVVPWEVRVVVSLPGGKGVEGRRIATGQDVAVRAEVAPVPKAKLHYRWTLNDGSSFGLGGAAGQETRVQRSRTGSVKATVTVTDENGCQIGSAEGSWQVESSGMHE